MNLLSCSHTSARRPAIFCAVYYYRDTELNGSPVFMSEKFESFFMTKKMREFRWEKICLADKRIITFWFWIYSGITNCLFTLFSSSVAFGYYIKLNRNETNLHLGCNSVQATAPCHMNWECTNLAMNIIITTASNIHMWMSMDLH